MHILVTNDDGVQAPGLLALAQAMRKLIACCAAVLFGGIAAAEAQTEIKFGHVGEPGSLFQLSALMSAPRSGSANPAFTDRSTSATSLDRP